MIKVSIIVPVYNAAQFIESCVDSVMSQTYTFMECIFISDCTSDNSISLIQEKLRNYKGNKEFIIIHHEKNLGAAAARNTGLRKATGDYIYFLDSDDEIFPDTIENLVNLVVEYPNVDVVQGEMVCEHVSLNETLSISDKNFSKYTASKLWLSNHFLLDIPVSPCGKLVNLKFLKGNNVTFEEGIMHEDILWRFKLGKSVKSIAFCSAVGYKYRYNTSSVTTAPENDIKRIDSYIYVLKFMIDHITYDFRFAENLSLLKQFHHAKLMGVLPENVEYKKRLVNGMLSLALSKNTLLTVFKPSYVFLMLPVGILTSISWLWNKNMGLLYRFTKSKNKKFVKTLNG